MSPPPHDSPSHERAPAASRRSTALALAVVVASFCVPLFVGLDRWDLANDEAIYSYSVDRILETGEWLTPRLIPDDGPFLEKPPLKFWMVAALIRSGLLPQNELGMRFLDAVFGSLAFVYVFALGQRLSGPLCGAIAVLTLFTFDVLIFDHGLRSNNMEAALVLAYCGGIHHFARWADEDAGRRRLLHALAVAGFFVLGFMTKFVAALFLPVVVVAAFALRPDALARLRAGWRDWLLATLLVLAATVPWFVYEAIQQGDALWRTMFGQHVYTRFTSSLDPQHLHPWHYYYSMTWKVFSHADNEWLALVGLVTLAVMAWRGRPWLARLLFVWWLFPYALMSLGSSKLIHYAYPFLPPIALGAGMVATFLFHVVERSISRGVLATVAAVHRRVAGWRGASLPNADRPADESSAASRRWVPLQRLLLGVAMVALALGLWSALVGPVRLDFGGVEIRSSTISRPLFTAAILLALSGYLRALSRPLALAIVATALPLVAYSRGLDLVTTTRRPLSALRSCGVSVKSPADQVHVYPTYADLGEHTHYYYLHGIAPVIVHAGTPNRDEWESRLFAPGTQTLVVLSMDDYDAIGAEVARGDSETGQMPRGLALSNNNVLLGPGPLQVCAMAALASGGKAISPPAGQAP